jgi:hypothetical protein
VKITEAYLLCLSGLFFYIFAAPLLGLIRAGIPPQEWFFYLLCVLLVALLPLYAGYRLRHCRLGMAAGLGASATALVLGIVLAFVFHRTPLWPLAWLGYTMVVLSPLTAMWIVRGIRSQRVWLSGIADKVMVLALLALVIACAVSWGGFGARRVLVVPAGRPRISFWNSANSLVLSDDVLPALRDMGATCYLFTGENLLDEDRRDLFRQSMERFAQFDVDVVLASILPSADGFVSTVNFDEYIAYTEQLLDFAQTEGLSAVKGVIADAEPPYSIFDPYHQESVQDWLVNENGRFRRWDPAEYARALSGYATYIKDFDARHPRLEISVSTIQTAIFDALDGDADLSTAYKFAAFPPRNWSNANVQLYSSRHVEDGAPYFVWQGLKIVQNVVTGIPLSASVGIVGRGSMQRDGGFRRLVEDIRLSYAMGADEVIVFTLGRGLASFGPDFVERLNEAVLEPGQLEIKFSRTDAFIAYAAGVWDAVLDLAGHRGVIVWGWCVLVLTRQGLRLALNR